MPTLAEQVAALEAERDYWRESWEMADERAALDQRERLAAESRLAEMEAERDQALRDLAYQTDRRQEAIIARQDALARLASARVEGAREALTKLAEEARLTDKRPHIAQYIREVRDREYPAPAAPAGEQEGFLVWSCSECKRGGTGLALCAVKTCKATTQTRPAPTPEPEPLVLVVDIDGKECEVTLTPTYCRLIVALGSRPTQTAEG